MKTLTLKESKHTFFTEKRTVFKQTNAENLWLFQIFHVFTKKCVFLFKNACFVSRVVEACRISHYVIIFSAPDALAIIFTIQI